MTELVVEESSEYENLLNVKETKYNPLNVLEILEIEDNAPKDNKEWREHWLEMPEFEQDKVTHFKKLLINFETEKDYNAFGDLIGQKLTKKTRSIWYPEHKPAKNTVLRWVLDDE